MTSESGTRPIDPHLRLAAHELRSPLAAIRGAADFLVSDGDQLGAETRELVGMIQRNALRMQRLIDDILLLGRIDRGEVSIRFDEVALDSLVRSTLMTIHPIAEDRGVEFVVDSSLDDIHLTTDYNLISHIIEKIVENAARHARPNSTVRIVRETVDGFIALSVIDEGPGIPPEQREVIFERFQRIAAAVGESSGAGLGLPLARGLAEVLGYRLILADAKAGSGSHFTVIFDT